jgi:hypothetical protein
MFTRSHSYQSSLTREVLKKRLIGSHVKIHNLDFEVTDNNHVLTIIPHTEQIDEIKTLPITTVSFVEGNGSTKVQMVSRMRQLDQGGPMLVMILIALLLITGSLLYFAFHDRLASYIIAGVGVLIFIIFWTRLQMGYFDYVRKVRQYVIDTEKK